MLFPLILLLFNELFSFIGEIRILCAGSYTHQASYCH